MVDLHTDYPLARARMAEDAERAARYRLLHRRVAAGRWFLDRFRARGAGRQAITGLPDDTAPGLDRAA